MATRSWNSGGDEVGAHHVVGLVLEDVAVPEVFAGVALERNDDARDCVGWALHNVFPTEFVRCGWKEIASGDELFVREIVVDGEALAVEDLEAHHVQMDRVDVFGEVDEGPDFGRVELDDFGHGFDPVLAVEEHDHGVAVVAIEFVERHFARADGLRFWDARDGAELGGDRGGLADRVVRDAELHDVERVADELDVFTAGVRKVDEDVDAFGGSEDEAMYFDG